MPDGKKRQSPAAIKNKKAPLKNPPPKKPRAKYGKNHNGRPTVRTPEARKAILQALELGASLCNAARYARIDPETLTLWRRDDTQFFVACEEARAKLCIAYLASNRRAVANGNVTAVHWGLERFFPEDYGRREIVPERPQEEAPGKIYRVAIEPVKEEKRDGG